MSTIFQAQTGFFLPAARHMMALLDPLVAVVPKVLPRFGVGRGWGQAHGAPFKMAGGGGGGWRSGPGAGLHFASFINRPKDVQGCSAAPEEFSVTAVLVSRFSTCVCVGGGGRSADIPPPPSDGWVGTVEFR